MPLCSSDADCGTGNDCEEGLICVEGLCVAGCRSGGPSILTVDGDGTEDTGPADARGTVAAHHIQTQLTITGTDLSGAAFSFVDTSGNESELLVANMTDTRVVAEVPDTLQPGEYTLVATNAAGSDQATAWVVRGEEGPQGPPPDAATIQSAVSAMTDLDIPSLAGRVADGYQRTDRWGRFFEAETDFVSANVNVGATFTTPDPTASGTQGRKVEYGDDAGILYQVVSTDVGELLANGTAVIEARMRVFDNASASADQPILSWACNATTDAGAAELGVMNLNPNSFTGPNVWQTFFLQCAFRPDDIEQSVSINYLRGDQTDLSIDFVRVSPAPHAGRGTSFFGGPIHMAGGQTFYSPGRMHIDGEERLYLLHREGVHVSKAWGGNGDLTVDGWINMAAGQRLYSPGRMHIDGEERLYLLHQDGVYVSQAWGGNGDLTVEGTIYGNLTGSASSVGGAQIFLKDGNNGAVNCQTFCAGPQWGRTGACLGGGFRRDDDSDTPVDCTSAISPGGAGFDYACVCVTGL